MFRLFFAAMLFAVLADMVCAQSDLAVMFEAKRLGSSRDTTTKWQDGFGGSDRDFSESIALELRIQNLRNTKTNATLEIFFVAKEASGNTRWVFDQSSDSIALDISTPIHLQKKSSKMKSTVMNDAFFGTRSARGGVLDGYIARLVSEGKVQRVCASSSALVAIGHDDARLQELIKNKPVNHRVVTSGNSEP